MQISTTNKGNQTKQTIKGNRIKVIGVKTSTITQLRDERASLILIQAIGSEGLTPWMASRSTYAREVRSSE
jgi:hypothetical protein